jgi:hypothetical protein
MKVKWNRLWAAFEINNVFLEPGGPLFEHFFAGKHIVLKMLRKLDLGRTEWNLPDTEQYK